MTTATAATPVAPPPPSNFARGWRRFGRNRLAVLGLILSLGLIGLAALAPVISPYDFATQNMQQRLFAPGASHWLGTDHFGRDVATRIIYGGRTSLSVGILSVGLGMLVGIPMGALAGYFRGKTDAVISWMLEIMLAFPGLLLAIAVASALGASLTNSIIAIGIINIPQFARLVRSSVMQSGSLDYIQAAQAIGCRDWRIIFRHVLPNVLPLLIVRATLGIGGAILTEAGLSFIGLGAQPPVPSWGSMLADGVDFMRKASFLTTFPGLIIMAAVLAFNWFGDGLRDALDPRMKR